jgi:hypothetical protein
MKRCRSGQVDYAKAALGDSGLGHPTRLNAKLADKLSWRFLLLRDVERWVPDREKREVIA